MRGNTRQYSSRDMASQTRMKFRQAGQGTKSEIERRDLKLELERAEKRHRNGGKDDPSDAPKLMVEASETREEDEQAAKRRKILEEAAVLDKDDSDDERRPSHQDKGKGRAVSVGTADGAANGDDKENAESSEDEDDDSEEDETAELLRELEKIKRERAEEKARQEQEQASADASDRDAAIAMGNPLLNLQAALAGGNATPGSASTASSGFAVKRRWDDDVIFRNQGISEKPKKEFVNDLLVRLLFCSFLLNKC